MIWTRELGGTRRASVVVGGQGAFEQLGMYALQAAAAGSRLFVITDENVERAWGERILDLLGAASGGDYVLALTAGEGTKSLSKLELCWNWLAFRGARREDVVVALGGGVVGDLAGFAAATYLRGLSLWQIPTSVLAQVDSSVGGKTAVNLEAGKNLVGSFYQPDFVVIEPGTLATLPEEEYVSGLGEVVKYCLLHGEDLLDVLEKNIDAVRVRDRQIMDDLVRRCVNYKADVVEEDEFDQGRRAVLNLGHTAAHALERTVGYGAISHGSAVALGLLVAVALSEEYLGLEAEVLTRTRRILERLGIPTTIDLPPVESMLAAATRDKKISAGGTGFVGLASLGAPVWGLNVTPARFAAALEVIRA